jgi:hypothetical protein
MARIPLVSNELRTLHGDSIYERYGDTNDLERIFLVDITHEKGKLKVRRSYYDLQKKETVQSARDGLLKGSIRGTPWNQKGGTVKYTKFEIDFGWKPCHVVIALDALGMKFHPYKDDGLSETIVFRRDKLEIRPDKTTLFSVKGYEPNFSFYNFERDAEYEKDDKKIDVIWFDNFMLDSRKNSIGYGPGEDVWSYCMDIYVLIPFNPAIFSLGLVNKASEESTVISPTNISDDGKWMILVFDPPQDNGGGGGPPR